MKDYNTPKVTEPEVDIPMEEPADKSKNIVEPLPESERPRKDGPGGN